MAINGKVSMIAQLTETKTIDLASASASLNKAVAWTVTSGTAADQADLSWSDTRSLAASAAEDLDLAGTLTSIYGTALTFVKLKGLMVIAASTNPGSLTVGRAAAAGVPWISAVSAGVVLPAGGSVCWLAPTAGITVVPTTADMINVAAAATAGTYTYDVVVVGTSA
jgi:hypothetical protein